MPPKKSVQTSLSFGAKPASKQGQLNFGSKKSPLTESTFSKGKTSAPKASQNSIVSKASTSKRGIEKISSNEEPEKSQSPAKKETRRLRRAVVESESDVEVELKMENTDRKSNSKNLDGNKRIASSFSSPAKSVQKDKDTKQKIVTPASSKKEVKPAVKQVEPDTPLKDMSKLKKLDDLKFCPVADSPQHKGQRLPFQVLANALQLIEDTSGKDSRTVVVETICNCFRSCLVNYPEELADLYYFFIVKLAPDFVAMETGVGHEVSVKAVAKACGKLPKEVRELYKQEGDLGLVVQKGKKNMSTLGGFFKTAKPAVKKYLTFDTVFQNFRKIAQTSGQNSATIKEQIFLKLLQDATNDEAKYIVRFLQKTLKTGAAEKTVIVALARAIAYTPPNKPKMINQKKKLGDEKFFELSDQIEMSIKQAVCEYPDYGHIIQVLQKIGDDHELLKEDCHIRVGIPVKPMLAKPTKGVSIILQRFEGIEFTCEYKYDGFRGQIHFDRSKAAEGKDCHIYSRNLENMSIAYPDVLEIIREVSNSKPDLENFIIDAELVAYNIENAQILPFQTLTQRSRKHVNEKDLKTKICIMAFDVLYLNGKALLPETFQSRRGTLRTEFGELAGKFMFAKHSDTSSFEELEKFLDLSVKDSCEGLMVKTLTVNSTYMPSKRSFNWLKLKKDYLETSMGDSVDLVVIGADYGVGKRTGIFGSYLLAAWNEDIEAFQSICKCGTGFSDERFAEIKAELDEHIIDKPHSSVKIKDLPQIRCDVYFVPRFVWEIKAADLSLSPMHTAASGAIEEGKGIALRFPRHIRSRDDKKPEECTNTEQVVEMYRGQAMIQNVNFNDDNDFDL